MVLLHKAVMQISTEGEDGGIMNSAAT
jgi:hypothetical protein